MVACTLSKLPQDETSSGESDATSSTAGGSASAGESSTSVGSASASSTSVGETSTGPVDSSTSVGEGTTSAGSTSAGSGDPDDLPPGCVGLDHPTCFDAMVDACAAQGNWDVTPACVDAVANCYPIGAPDLAASDVVDFCSAEIDGHCLFSGGPGCGETFCTCTAGGYPFDWSNCWHLLLVACYDSVASDCESVLAGCYPGVSVEAFSQCQDQVMEDLGHECNCPMCGIHDECKDALDTCLGA